MHWLPAAPASGRLRRTTRARGRTSASTSSRRRPRRRRREGHQDQDRTAAVGELLGVSTRSVLTRPPPPTARYQLIDAYVKKQQ